LDLSVFLDDLTWSATPAYEDVIARITTDRIPPAHIRTGDGLWDDPHL
jgi:hypothetical protein